mgnify:CR=1 FL=1
MASRLGHDVLSVFDVPEEALDALCDIVESGTVPEDEQRRLWNQSLMGGAEDWQYLIDCATSLQHKYASDRKSLEGNDVLTYVGYIFASRDVSFREPWGETDRLMAEARRLQDEFRHNVDASLLEADVVTDSSKRKRHRETSRFWATGSEDTCRNKRQKAAGMQAITPRAIMPIRAASSLPLQVLDNFQKRSTKPLSTTSPYFPSSPEKNKEAKSPKRPPAGTISCIPFPTLSSDNFGIIQEELAHSPFWLLVAITFLIKTSGQLAIPTFRNIKDRFPSPEAIGDPDNAAEIIEMTRHLGLCMMRLKYLQKYARAFMQTPPKANIRYCVKHYDARDLDIDDVSADTQAWEIGHMTQGKYALDSWRIFCRDELLSRAEDWNGKGREGEFQPEWMRVMPTDKELRAYLRWMWMREGWEWDPITGEKTVLRDEMRMAVDEGRVEYDDTGGLRILASPRHTTK